MKKLLAIVVLGMLMTNNSFSKEILTLVCSFDKSVIEIPNATSGDGETVKDKSQLSPSITQDKYIVLDILSENAANVLDTSFHHNLNGKFEYENIKANFSDTEISFLVRIHEDWINNYILNKII